MSMFYAILAVNCFVLLLCVLIEISSRLLRQQGQAELKINDFREIKTELGITLYEALAKSQIYLPAACGGKGTCSHCAVTVTNGGNRANALERTCLSPEQLKSGLRLSCQQKIRGNIAVVIDQDLMNATRFSAMLTKLSSVSSAIKTLEFVADETEIPDLLPGQYIQVLYDLPYERVMRAYSVSSVFRISGNIHFTLDVQLVEGGLMSNILHSFSSGEKLTFCGAYGHMCLQQHHCNSEILLIAGGVGLAPMRYIVQSLADSGHTGRVNLYHGARTRDGLYADANLKKLASSNDWFKYIPVLSAPLIEDGWTLKPTMVHQAISEDGHISSNSYAFICGPAPMVQAVQKVLVDKGLSPDRILTDPFDF